MTHPARLDHIGITVADLDAATAWYGAALGLRPDFDFALPQFGFRASVLLAPGGYRIELIERTGSAPGPSPANPIEAAATRGFGHVCLDVEDVDAQFDALIALGAGERMSPRPSPEPGVRMAYVADPEGNLIELIDRTAAGRRPASESPAQPHIPVG